MTYAPSTRHLLADLEAGTPWRTKLPFPVQVVDRIDVTDAIGETRLTTRFAYHDGYFDGREREFRGFARVDRFDAEALEGIAHHVPPIETRTWFHTGALLDGGPHEIDTGGTPYEAFRALRGALLRSEVFGRDDSSAEARPYTVIEARHRVICLQPRSEHAAVYYRYDLEQVTSHIERELADPRIQQSLTLAVDAFGSPTRSATIAYGRERPDPSLPRDSDRDVQARTHVVYTATSFTNAIDDGEHYRAPLECERRTFELTGFAPAGARVSAADLAAADTLPALAFEAEPTAGTPQKRTIGHTRVYFRADDLTRILALGSVEPFAFGGITQRLAFTPGLVASVYGDRVSSDMLRDQGGYVHSENDTAWWAESGRTFLSPDPGSPADELAHARRTFFMPQRFRDAFGNERRSGYDAYCLLSTHAVDAVGNQTTAVHDYRVLQPMHITDPNNSSTEAAFDERGLVVATAIAGAAGEGDDLQGLIPDLTRAELDAFFADPVAHAPALLGNATTRIVRDLERTPSYEATIRRDRHGTPSTISLAFTYVDGFGRAVQTKQQTETARWIASGSTVFNNKGKPVEQYEPFFDDTHVFRPATQVGVSATTFYDPAERVVATLRPDHAWNKTVVDPWRSETWDFNDTVAIADPKSDPDVGAYFARLADAKYLPTWHGARAAGQLGPAEQEAAEKTAMHAGTPSITCADALGRTVLAIGHNRYERGGVTIDEHGATRFALDITGNIRSVTDASERVVIRNVFDMLDRRIHCAHLDAGERWLLCDVGGFAIAAWDSRGHRVRTTYDAASRPLETFLAQGAAPEIVVGRMVYGETEPAATNARGRAVRAFDQAGVVETAHYDFKGNVLASVRRLTRSYRETIDWSADPALETEIFTTRFEYDAENRVVAKIAPDGSIERRIRNLAGQLAHLDLALGGAPVPIVSTVEYNARGQRRASSTATPS